ncbi:MAG: TIGR01777 family oxidoreductase [Cyclobacteriaceae bacterium]
MMRKILITGASGLIGARLTEMLLQKGHRVVHVGRGENRGEVPFFKWDVSGSVMQEEAFYGVDAVVHLAGAGVAEKRWTPKRKREILESRTKSTALLAQYVEGNHLVKTVVAASAIGYYGIDCGDEELTEDSPPGKDFLAEVVKAWENEVDKIKNKRLVKLRIGIVLSGKGGALKEMAKPVRWGVGAALGSGKQQTSWIHIDDVCNMFIYALENESLNGVYNVTGPSAVSNEYLTKAIARTLRKSLWLPNVPTSVLKIVLGEMADMVVNGSNVSSKKIQQAGYTLEFPDLEEALKDLLGK